MQKVPLENSYVLPLALDYRARLMRAVCMYISVSVCSYVRGKCVVCPVTVSAEANEQFCVQQVRRRKPHVKIQL